MDSGGTEFRAREASEKPVITHSLLSQDIVGASLNSQLPSRMSFQLQVVLFPLLPCGLSPLLFLALLSFPAAGLVRLLAEDLAA